MTLVFDAATTRFDSYVLLILPAATLGIALFNLVRGRRKWAWIMSGVTILLFLLTLVLPLADAWHVRAALTDGSVKVSEGVISQHRRETRKSWAGSSAGVGVSSFSRYTSSTSEQFFVGPQWFWLRVAGFPSGASFTNAKDPPLPLRDGTRVRVTWFNDPWNGDETRILKLEIDEASAAAAAKTAPARPSGPAVTANAAALPADFAAFWKRFSTAASAGDRDGIKALTRFPFLFAGTPLDAARFNSIWMGIFPQPLRSCFATAVPVKDADAWSASCGAYVYIFTKGDAGWQFTDFAADPEGME